MSVILFPHGNFCSELRLLRKKTYEFLKTDYADLDVQALFCDFAILHPSDKLMMTSSCGISQVEGFSCEPKCADLSQSDAPSLRALRAAASVFEQVRAAGAMSEPKCAADFQKAFAALHKKIEVGNVVYKEGFFFLPLKHDILAASHGTECANGAMSEPKCAAPSAEKMRNALYLAKIDCMVEPSKIEKILTSLNEFVSFKSSFLRVFQLANCNVDFAENGKSVFAKIEYDKKIWVKIPD